MLLALSNSGARVDDLFIEWISWRVFKSRILLQDLAAPFMNNFKTLELMISLVDAPTDWFDPDEAGVYFQESNALHRFLRQFPNLVSLHVSFEYDAVEEELWTIGLSHIQGQTMTWPFLTHLRLNSVPVLEKDLIAFLQRHRLTLRNLLLSNIFLQGDTDSWLTCLPRVQQILTLDFAQISEVISSRKGEYWQIHRPSCPGKDLCTIIARYLVLRCGRLPLTTDNAGLEEERMDDDDEHMMDMWTPIKDTIPM